MTRFLPIAFAAVVALGAGRIAFYYLIHEPVANLRGPHVGAEFEPLKSLIHARRVAYLSDEPVDADPRKPREHDRGDMMYARAQYALEPVILDTDGRDLPLALASFGSPAALERLIAGGGYEVLARPSPSIALLRRR